MSIRFLDAKEIPNIKKRVNRDAEFRLAARYMSEDILIGAGDKQCIFKIRDGTLIDIVLNPTLLDKSSFYIKGPEKSWQIFLQRFPPPFYQAFFSAVMREDFQFGGNMESIFAYYWAIQRLLNIMRILQNERRRTNASN